MKNKATALPDKKLFISRKRSRQDFVLVRVLDSESFSMLRLQAIEGKLYQLDVRFIRNRFELEALRQEKRLRLEGLYVELEHVAEKEYRRFERLVN